MTDIKLTRKEIIVDEKEIHIVTNDHFGCNTVAFLADIPKNALVTSVLVNGKHLKNAKYPAEKVTVEYLRDEHYEGKRVVAVLHSEYDGNKIVDAAKMLAIKSFVVEFIGTAIAEV